MAGGSADFPPRAREPPPTARVHPCMDTDLARFAADHRYLLQTVARRAGFADPLAIELDEFYWPLLRAARKRELLPIDGVLVRDWDPDNRRTNPGMNLG